MFNKLKPLLKSNISICAILFILSFGTYLSNLRYIGVTDTTTNERFAANFAKTGHLYLDEKVEFTNLLAEDDFPTQISNTHEKSGKFYSKYPASLSILAFPFFKTAEIVGIDNTNFIGKITGAFITALSLPILYLALRKITKQNISVIITIIYGFASSSWGISSQALWQHTFSQLFSVIILYLLFHLIQIKDLKSDQKTRFLGLKLDISKVSIISYFLIGFLLALNITVRPTNAIAAILIGILVLFSRNKKYIGSAIFGGLIPLSLLVAYNYMAFGSLLDSGYGSESSSGWSAPFHQGFLGLVFSPSIGLLVFSPIFIFAFIGAAKILLQGIKKFKFEFSKQNIFLASILVFISNWLVYSKWWAWHGDSWVYRMLMDGIPYLLVGFILPFEKLFIKPQSTKNKSILVLGSIMFLFSVYTQFLGAFSYDYSWDSRYKVSWKNYSYLFNFPKSRLIYYLENQKYYLNFPNKTVYVLNDKFGDTINFETDNLYVNGEKNIIHSVFLSSGRSPKVENNLLKINTKYDGVSFYISDNYLSKELEIKISIDMTASDQNSTLQMRQIGGKGETIKKVISSEMIFNTKNASEIRIQNDEISDNISVKQIKVSVKD